MIEVFFTLYECMSWFFLIILFFLLQYNCDCRHNNKCLYESKTVCLRTTYFGVTVTSKAKRQKAKANIFLLFFCPWERGLGGPEALLPLNVADVAVI